MSSLKIAFIGGGNMAQAIIAGLISAGQPSDSILVVEPSSEQRSVLVSRWGVSCWAEPTDDLRQADIAVWAIKPQSFAQAAAAVMPFTRGALQVSVMAGIPTNTLADQLQTERVIRAMPNTPALIGQGISGLFARQSVDTEERRQAEAMLSSTGQVIWFDQEDALDAVTAISGSGPAYVFFVIEALVEAAQSLGLSAQQGLQLALATFRGSTALALSSGESPLELRQKVTSKGGTTHAAISHLENQKVRESFIQAVTAARDRARQMGEEFGTKR